MKSIFSSTDYSD